MAATKQDISNWYDKAKTSGATHLVVVCDTFDWEDYPVYVGGSQQYAKESVEAAMKEYDNTNMQKIMEIYNMSLDKDSQMNEYRAYHP